MRLPAGWRSARSVLTAGTPLAVEALFIRWTIATTSPTVASTISTPITETRILSARNDPSSTASLPTGAEIVRLTADAAAAGQRLDRWLAGAIGTLSRSRVKALIEGHHLRRDGAVVTDVSEAVREGAEYSLAIPPALPARPQAQDIPLTVLFEDRHLIVLDKPAGLVVHPAPGNLDGTLVNALLSHAGEELTGIGGEARPGIVHRLDKDTSGVMVVAKSERAHQRLSEAFAARDLERSYLALAWGVPAPAAGEVDAPIGRHPTDRKRMAVVARNGKNALTRYATEKAWAGAVALLRCRLATGRTHQIRVHMAHIGHPLVGDPVYLRRLPAAKTLDKSVRDILLSFPRQALHAETLGFNHPITKEVLSFSTPLPADMQGLITLLEGNAA